MSCRNQVATVVAAVTLGVLAINASGSPLSETRQTELQHLLRHDCGSCHGMTLKGGLGPALTQDALVEKPKAYIQQTIRDGHPGTPMPPWGSLLSQTDIEYLVELLTGDNILQ